MFIFGQALLKPLIGTECENAERILPWLSHDGTNSPTLITCTVLSLESISAEYLTSGLRHNQWTLFYKCVENESANVFELLAYVGHAEE